MAPTEAPEATPAISDFPTQLTFHVDVPKDDAYVEGLPGDPIITREEASSLFVEVDGPSTSGHPFAGVDGSAMDQEGHDPSSESFTWRESIDFHRAVNDLLETTEMEGHLWTVDHMEEVLLRFDDLFPSTGDQEMASWQHEFVERTIANWQRENDPTQRDADTWTNADGDSFSSEAEMAIHDGAALIQQAEWDLQDYQWRIANGDFTAETRGGLQEKLRLLSQYEGELEHWKEIKHNDEDPNYYPPDLAPPITPAVAALEKLTKAYTRYSFSKFSDTKRDTGLPMYGEREDTHHLKNVFRNAIDEFNRNYPGALIGDSLWDMGRSFAGAVEPELTPIYDTQYDKWYGVSGQFANLGYVTPDMKRQAERDRSSSFQNTWRDIMGKLHGDADKHDNFWRDTGVFLKGREPLHLGEVVDAMDQNELGWTMFFTIPQAVQGSFINNALGWGEITKEIHDHPNKTTRGMDKFASKGKVQAFLVNFVTDPAGTMDSAESHYTLDVVADVARDSGYPGVADYIDKVKKDLGIKDFDKLLTEKPDIAANLGSLLGSAIGRGASHITKPTGSAENPHPSSPAHSTPHVNPPPPPPIHSAPLNQPEILGPPDVFQPTRQPTNSRDGVFHDAETNPYMRDDVLHNAETNPYVGQAEYDYATPTRFYNSPHETPHAFIDDHVLNRERDAIKRHEIGVLDQERDRLMDALEREDISTAEFTSKMNRVNEIDDRVEFLEESVSADVTHAELKDHETQMALDRDTLSTELRRYDEARVALNDWKANNKDSSWRKHENVDSIEGQRLKVIADLRLKELSEARKKATAAHETATKRLDAMKAGTEASLFDRRYAEHTGEFARLGRDAERGRNNARTEMLHERVMGDVRRSEGSEVPSDRAQPPSRPPSLDREPMEYGTHNRGDAALEGYDAIALHFSNLAYKNTHTRENHAIDGFRFIPHRGMSNSRRGVWYKPDTNEYMVAFRGTKPTNAVDLASDAFILTGTTNLSARFNLERDFVKELANRHPDAKIHLVGHSLAGSISLYVNQALRNTPQIAQATAINPGQTHTGNAVTSLLQNPDVHAPYAKRTKIIVQQGDPVSTGFIPSEFNVPIDRGVYGQTNIYTNMRGTRNPLKAHQLGTFKINDPHILEKQKRREGDKRAANMNDSLTDDMHIVRRQYRQYEQMMPLRHGRYYRNPSERQPPVEEGPFQTIDANRSPFPSVPDIRFRVSTHYADRAGGGDEGGHRDEYDDEGGYGSGGEHLSAGGRSTTNPHARQPEGRNCPPGMDFNPHTRRCEPTNPMFVNAF